MDDSPDHLNPDHLNPDHPDTPRNATGEALLAPPALPKHPLFMGRFGLRAGWGIAIFVLVYAILVAASGFLALAVNGQLSQALAIRRFIQTHPSAPHPQLHLLFTPALVLTEDTAIFLGLLGACWLLAKGEHRRLSAFGIGRRRWTDLFAGAFWGLVAMSALVAVLRSIHVLIFDGRALHGPAIVLYGAKWLLAFLLVGLAEEYSFRGYLQYTLMRGVWGLAERIAPVRTRPTAFWIAATLLSGLFAAVHTNNTGETYIGILQVFLAGMTLSYGLFRTGSLWWSIGMHMTWDWAQSFLFGVADSGNVSIGRLFVTHPAGNPILSGGSDGPEGSLIGVAALTFLCLIIHFTTRPGVQPALEPEPREPVDSGATAIA